MPQFEHFFLFAIHTNQNFFKKPAVLHIFRLTQVTISIHNIKRLYKEVKWLKTTKETVDTKTETVMITGNKPLRGTVTVQGSKNAALPIIAACALINGKVTLYNVPNIYDIRMLINILESLGAKYTFEMNVLEIDCSELQNGVVTEEFTNQIRASSLLLGPLLARFGRAELGMPGGCSIGSRPLDIHMSGFEKLGAVTKLEYGVISIGAESLEGEFHLPLPSVGATQNLVMSAMGAKKPVMLHNIAIEPEVMDMIHFLQEAGAEIEYISETKSLMIHPCKLSTHVTYHVQSDRVEAGTLLCAGLITKGEVTVTDINPYHMQAMLATMEQMGADVSTTENSVTVAYKEPLRSVDITTMVYPGFPTDMQPQFGALFTQAEGRSMITETLFNSRFRYFEEMRKMNAQVKLDSHGHTCMVERSQLTGCKVEGHDLRGTAALVLAGLSAEGISFVTGLRHMYRGYEDFITKLNHLGANIIYM